MAKIYENIKNKKRYFILFGENDLRKIDFIESLCIFLCERKVIKSYEIFRIFSEIDYKYTVNKLEKEIEFDEFFGNEKNNNNKI